MSILWKPIIVLKETSIITMLDCDLCSGQEPTPRKKYKGESVVYNGQRYQSSMCFQSLSLFSLYAEHMLETAVLDLDEGWLKIDASNINKVHRWYIIQAETNKKLKWLLRKVFKKGAGAGLQLIIQKTKITLRVFPMTVNGCEWLFWVFQAFWLCSGGFPSYCFSSLWPASSEDL